MTEPAPKKQRKQVAPLRLTDRLVFDESVTFSDLNPGAGWNPSPTQIAAWSEIVRQECEAMLDVSQSDLHHKRGD